MPGGAAEIKPVVRMNVAPSGTWERDARAEAGRDVPAERERRPAWGQEIPVPDWLKPVMLVLIELCAVAICFLGWFWPRKFLGNIYWYNGNPYETLNLHIATGCLSWGFLTTQGVLVHMIWTGGDRVYSRSMHALVQLAAGVLGVVVAYLGFKAHWYMTSTVLSGRKIGDMYSLHSWVGLGTLVLMGLQIVGGFFSFMWPGNYLDHRTVRYWHFCSGITVFLLGLLTNLLGVVQTLSFRQGLYFPKFLGGKVSMRDKWEMGVANYGPEPSTANFLGLLHMVLGFACLFVIVHFRGRPTQPRATKGELRERRLTMERDKYQNNAAASTRGELAKIAQGEV